MSDLLDEALADFDKSQGTETVEETPAPEPEVEAVETEEAPVEEAETAETEEGPSDEQIEEGRVLYAGKYTTPEDLERAYEELQSRMGSQGAELGELRKLVEERLPEKEDPQFDFARPESIDWFDDQIEQNPYGAAVWALENDRTGTLYRRAMSQWFVSDPDAASDFKVALAVESMKGEVEKQQQPLREQAEKQLIFQAWDQASKEIPEMNELATAIMEEAKDSPEILRSAHTLEEKTKAYKKLYRLAKQAQTSTVEHADAEAKEQDAASARAAKLSGTSPQSKVVVPEKISEDEKWAREFLDPHLVPYQARD